MTKEEYDKIYPVGSIVLPILKCDNSFTMNMLEHQKKIAIMEEVELLNSNEFGAKWEYKDEIGIVRVI